MYKFLFVVIVAALSVVANAQDLIVTNSGDTYKVKNLEIGQTAVFYTLVDDSTNATHRMNKSEILIIKFADGRTMTMDAAATSVQPATGGEMNAIGKERPAETAETNRNMINKANVMTIVYDEKERKNSDAGIFLLGLGLKSESVVYDGVISVNIVPGFIDYTENFKPYAAAELSDLCYGAPMFVAELKNHTDKTVYVDLANSFVVRGQEALPYYVPSVTSTMSSTTGGGSVNLGAVTGAMGIGGAVGTLAKGVNVGGSTTSGTVTTVYAQRVVAVPPMSVVQLSPQAFISGGKALSEYVVAKENRLQSAGDLVGLNSELEGVDGLKIGDMAMFSESDDFFNISMMYSYSFSETLENPRNLQLGLYMKSALGIGRKTIGYKFYDKGLANGWNSTLFVPAFKEK